jgi:hydroxymethylbilane synthase
MILIGSRGSALARTQSQQIADQLTQAGHPARLKIIKTRGDAILDRPFTEIPGKGFFTQEIEAALREGSVDLAVHSLKDLPTEDPSGLSLVAIPPREDPRDCLILRPSAHRPGAGPLPLVDGAKVGTSAVRRMAQLRALRPDLQVVPLRGNVPTRLSRLLEGRFDAIVLAQAGLNRLQLDLTGTFAVALPVVDFVPAPGQGALALQARSDDADIRAHCAFLDGGEGSRFVMVERQVLSRVEGGCHAPLGAYATPTARGAQMRLFYAPSAERPPIRACVEAADLPTLCAAAFAALQGGPVG